MTVSSWASDILTPDEKIAVRFAETSVAEETRLSWAFTTTLLDLIERLVITNSNFLRSKHALMSALIEAEAELDDMRRLVQGW